MTSEPILIRNFNLIKDLFDNLDVLTTRYKLRQRDIDIIHKLLTKHTTYNAYIIVKTSELIKSRRTAYRALEKLEEKNIITIVERPSNQYSRLKLYFTVDFINEVSGEDTATLYEQWLEWQKEFKNEKGDE